MQKSRKTQNLKTAYIGTKREQKMKTVDLEEVKKIVEAEEKREEYNRVCGIREFTKPKSMWMQMACKFYRKNTKNQGVAAVSWIRFPETMR